jgi:membrane protease YdiL (CAAX protease family)
LNFTEETPGNSSPEDLPQRLWNWLDVILITLVSLLILTLGVGILTVASRFTSEQSASNDGSSLLYNAGLTLIEAVALIGSVYTLGMLRRKLAWTDIGLRRPKRAWVIAGLSMTLALIPVAGAIAVAIRLLLDLPLESPQVDFLVPGNFSWPAAFGMLILGGIAVPFAEELYFRGVLYQWIRPRWGKAAGMILSGLAFGALHGEISVAGATFIMGVVLAWFFERSRSLWTPIIIHATYNSLELIFLYLLIATGISIPGVT